MRFSNRPYFMGYCVCFYVRALLGNGNQFSLIPSGLPLNMFKGGWRVRNGHWC